MFKKRKGQIWIETVIYTLIAFTIIGLVLTFVKPAIEKIQDKAIIDQSNEMLDEINLLINEIRVPGNQRLIELGLKKGTLKIDGAGDKLIFELETLYEYSEPGTNVSKGDTIVFTENRGKFNMVTLTRNYGDKYDLRSDDQDLLKTITKSPNPYNLLISNKGELANKIIINLKVS